MQNSAEESGVTEKNSARLAQRTRGVEDAIARGVARHGAKCAVIPRN